MMPPIRISKLRLAAMPSIALYAVFKFFLCLEWFVTMSNHFFWASCPIVAGIKRNCWGPLGRANVFTISSNVLKNSKISSISVEFNFWYSWEIFWEWGSLGSRGMSMVTYLSFRFEDSGSSFFGKIEKGQFAELIMIRKREVWRSRNEQDSYVNEE